MDEFLPFGRTEVTEEEICRFVDIESAIELAEQGGVPSPKERIGRFVSEIPSLLVWLRDNGRDYPWRHTTDPWRVYASEIMLQRTRGDAVEKVGSVVSLDGAAATALLP